MTAHTSPYGASIDPDNGGVDAITLLVADHDEVKEMFIDYFELVRGDGTDAERADLADQICQALTVHAAIEEEIFYPAARNALANPGLIDEAEEEHAQAEALIEQLQDMDASDDLFDNTVQKLQDVVEHHVQEEEQALFAQVRESSLDLLALGLEMAERKGEVLSQIDEQRTDD